MTQYFISLKIVPKKINFPHSFPTKKQISNIKLLFFVLKLHTWHDLKGVLISDCFLSKAQKLLTCFTSRQPFIFTCLRYQKLFNSGVNSFPFSRHSFYILCKLHSKIDCKTAAQATFEASLVWNFLSIVCWFVL